MLKMGFKELSKRLNTLNNNLLIGMIEDALNELEDTITELNKQQLEEGQKADESFLPPYSLNTTMQNPEKNGLIKLYDTGDFWKSFFSMASMGLLEIDAKDWKRDTLIEGFGTQILGLTPYSMKILCDMIADKLKIRIGEYLQQ
jgi:hypothetical protein